jgi:hypothetical protein
VTTSNTQRATDLIGAALDKRVWGTEAARVLVEQANSLLSGPRSASETISQPTHVGKRTTRQRKNAVKRATHQIGEPRTTTKITTSTGRPRGWKPSSEQKDALDNAVRVALREGGELTVPELNKRVNKLLRTQVEEHRLRGSIQRLGNGVRKEKSETHGKPSIYSLTE